MHRYALIMLNIIECVSIYLKKQGVEYARIILNVSDAVHSIRLLPALKLCVHFVYKNYTRCIQLMYKKYIQDVYKMYPTFRQTFVYILYTKLKGLWQQNFAYKMYTKYSPNYSDKKWYMIFDKNDIWYKRCSE